MDNLYCVGGENNLTDCRFDGWGISDCEESEAAGVICKPGPLSRLSATTTTTTTMRPLTTTTTTTMATTTTLASSRAANSSAVIGPSADTTVTKRIQQDMAPAMRIKV